MPKYTYTAESGDTHPIRLNADSATAGSFAAGATATSDIIAKVSKSDREFGLRPRGVRLSRNIGTDEIPNMRYRFLPVATESAYDAAAFNTNADVTVGSLTWQVVTRVPEDY